MNGPAQYKAAEQLIADARDVSFEDVEGAALILAEAQVRATLALAAAAASVHMGRDARGDWNEVGR